MTDPETRPEILATIDAVSIPSSSGKRCDSKAWAKNNSTVEQGVSIPSSSGKRCDKLHHIDMVVVDPVTRLNPFFIREAL